MMPISRRALIVALALFALACVIRAPLGLLTLFLPQRIQLKNVEGSIWNGRASAVGVGGIIIQQDVEWHFRPQSVLSASLAWGISGRFAEKASQLTFELRPGGSGLSQVSVFIPLEPLAALHPQLKAAQVGALLHVMSSHLSPHAPAKASVDVDQLFSSLIPQAGQLGRYQVDFDVAADGRGRWTLTSLPGPCRHGTRADRCQPGSHQRAVNPDSRCSLAGSHPRPFGTAQGGKRVSDRFLTSGSIS